MPEPDRLMIHFPVGGRLFNLRAAGIAVRDGHVLICREDDDPYTLLPGGRVEFGEDSRTSLARETAEELKEPGEIGRLLFTAETFFFRDGQEFHEIGVYYLLALPENLPFVTDMPALVTEDEGHRLTFYWVKTDRDALERFNLMPRWLRTRLGELPPTHEHLVMDER